MSTRTAHQLVDRALLLLGVTAVRPATVATTITAASLALRAAEKIGVQAVIPSITGSTHTTDELITRTFKKLMVLGDGDSATAEEHDNLLAIVSPTIASLSQRGIVNIANINAIENQYFEPLGDVLAWAYAADRGKAGDQGLQVRAQKAEADLRVMTLIGVMTSSIPAVVNDLNQRGIATISDTSAIPSYYQESLSEILVYRNATIFGKDEASFLTRAIKAESDLKTMTRISVVDNMVVGIIEDLNSRLVTYVADPNSIPIEVFEKLARIVAISAAPIFEKPLDYAALRSAESDLIVVKSAGPTFSVMQVDYF
jgi:hypothetical protein